LLNCDPQQVSAISAAAGNAGMYTTPGTGQAADTDCTSVRMFPQDRLLLQLQTALLGWEAGAAGDGGKAAALDRFRDLLYSKSMVPAGLLGMVDEELNPAEQRHIVRTVLQTDTLIISPDKLQQLLGLLAQQQPSIFRAGAARSCVGPAAGLPAPAVRGMWAATAGHPMLRHAPGSHRRRGGTAAGAAAAGRRFGPHVH
jgi:hypothetical protein